MNIVYILQFILLILSFYIFFKHILFVKSFQKYNYIFKFFLLVKVLLFTCISSVIIYFNQDVNFVLKEANFDNYSYSLIILIFYLFIFIILLNTFEYYENSLSSKYLIRNNTNINYISSAYILCVILVSLIFLLNLYLFGIPQLELFSGLNAQEIAYKRVSTLHNSKFNLFKNILGKELSIFLFFLSMNYWLCSTKKLSNIYLVFFIFLTFITVYYCTLELTKSGFANIVLYGSLFYFSVKAMQGYKSRVAFWLLGIGLIITCICFMFILVLPHMNSYQILKYIFDRVMFSQMSGYFFSSTNEFYSDIGVLSIVEYIGEVFKITNFLAPGQLITRELFPVEYYSGRMNYISTFFLSDVIWLSNPFMIIIASIHVSLFIRFAAYLMFFAKPRIIMSSFSAYCFFGTNFNSSYFPFIISSSVLFIIIFIITYSKAIKFKI